MQKLLRSNAKNNGAVYHTYLSQKLTRASLGFVLSKWTIDLIKMVIAVAVTIIEITHTQWQSLSIVLAS